MMTGASAGVLNAARGAGPAIIEAEHLVRTYRMGEVLVRGLEDVSLWKWGGGILWRSWGRRGRVNRR